MTMETRFTSLLGCRYPLQQAGMGGFTTPDLAFAVSTAGALGMLTGTIGAEALGQQLDAAPSSLVVGVNFLIPFLDRVALEDAAERSAFVEFFWGSPNPVLVDVVHRGGARAGWQVGSVSEACAARDAGCDVIAVQGIEAGGHVRGTVGVVALLSEVRAVVDLPLIGAGGIGTGEAMAAVLAAGADAVRVGTRFVAAQESIAHSAYVDALIASTADDTVLTTAFSEGWPDAPHRVLKSCIDAGNALGVGQGWSPEWPSKDYDGPPMARALYAGQSVGAVHSRQPAAEIIKELVEGADAILRR